MEDYIEAGGTKSKVIGTIMENCSLNRELSDLCLRFVRSNQDILSDEEFFQYSRLEEYDIDGVSEFVSESGEFYISLKKSTIFFVCLCLGSKFPALEIAKDIAVFWGICKLENGFVSLDAENGYLCIILELARNRRRGAEKSLFKRFKGECCNNQLECKYNENGLCNCKENMVEEICEEFVKQGIVKKKGKRYFYIL